MWETEDFLIVGITALAIFVIGVLLGTTVTGADSKESILDRMIVTNEAHDEGMYQVILDGKVYTYWYE